MNATALARFVDRLHQAFLEGDPEAPAKRAEEANVRRLQAAYRALARGDYAASVAAMTPDVEMEIIGPPHLPFVGRWRGRARAEAVLRQNFAQVEERHPEVLTVTAQGDTVVVVARERGRFKPTGRGYEVHWVQVLTFRAGRLARFREIVDNGGSLPTA